MSGLRGFLREHARYGISPPRRVSKASKVVDYLVDDVVEIASVRVSVESTGNASERVVERCDRG